MGAVPIMEDEFMDAFGGILLTLAILAGGGWIIWIGFDLADRELAAKRERFEKRLSDEEEERKNSVEWLRGELEAERIRNAILRQKNKAELEPLVHEINKAILQGKANKGMLDALLARIALLKAHDLNVEEKSQVDGVVDAMATMALGEMESRRADGRDTDDLEAIVETLRQASDKRRAA
jgi:hypothetical protein